MRLDHLINWYMKALRDYVLFNDRSGNAEFWQFSLVNMLITLGLVLAVFTFQDPLSSFLLPLYGLMTFIPNISLTIRRLHDTNRSGWWLLIFLLPYIGLIVLAIFCAQKGSTTENKYGKPPAKSPPKIIGKSAIP